MRSVEMPKQAYRTRLDANTSDLQEEPGIIRWVNNPTVISNSGTVTPIGFGPCAFKYVQAQAALASYTVAAKPASTALDNLTSGSTTQGTTSGLTADDLFMTLIYVYDRAAGAAAPEQEAVLCVDNTTTQVLFDQDTPLSAVLAVNDDLNAIRWAQAEAGASGDTAEEVQGIVVGDINASTTGLTAEYWGWVMAYGLARRCLVTDGVTAVENTSFKAGASGSITITSSGGGDTLGLALGHWMARAQTSLTTDYAPVFIDVLHPGGRAPLGA